MGDFLKVIAPTWLTAPRYGATALNEHPPASATEWTQTRLAELPPLAFEGSSLIVAFFDAFKGSLRARLSSAVFESRRSWNRIDFELT